MQLEKEDGPQETSTSFGVSQRGTKTRSCEQETVPDRIFSPKMYGTKGPHFSFAFSKSYLGRRLTEMSSPDSPLILFDSNKSPYIALYKAK